MNYWTISERKINIHGMPFCDWSYRSGSVWVRGRSYYIVGKRGQAVMRTLGGSLIGAPRGLIKALRDRRILEGKRYKERTYNGNKRQTSAHDIPERTGKGYDLPSQRVIM